MSKKLSLLTLISFLLYACAGATPHPVPQYQPGDEQMTCGEIKQEIVDNQTRIEHLIPKQNKTGKNVALGVAGAFFIVPWFFMDFSDAERHEVEAFQLRDNWLRRLSGKKHCGPLPMQIKFQGQK